MIRFTHQFALPHFALPVAMALGVMVCAGMGCHRDMRDQPRYETMESSDFFSDGQSARPLIEGTVARGSLNEEEEFHNGKKNGQFLRLMPVKVNRMLLERGQQRFNIFCAPCHDRTGAGNGMIVQRGFRRPPEYQDERLRKAPVGHFFDVITNGFGAMPRFAPQIPPHDRWAIVAYIRALQLHENATLNDVPDDIREKLGKEQP